MNYQWNIFIISKYLIVTETQLHIPGKSKTPSKMNEKRESCCITRYDLSLRKNLYNRFGRFLFIWIDISVFLVDKLSLTIIILLHVVP